MASKQLLLSQGPRFFDLLDAVRCVDFYDVQGRINDPDSFCSRQEILTNFLEVVLGEIGRRDDLNGKSWGAIDRGAIDVDRSEMFGGNEGDIRITTVSEASRKSISTMTVPRRAPSQIQRDGLRCGRGSYYGERSGMAPLPVRRRPIHSAHPPAPGAAQIPEM